MADQISIVRRPVFSKGNRNGVGACHFCREPHETVIVVGGRIEARFCDACARKIVFWFARLTEEASDG